MKELINYTAQDVERYHSGGLSPAQMHALEKAALDDPFLADALEGYTYTKTATADLTSIQQKLKQRIANDEKRGIFFISSNWMKIAALFVLIAGGGWFIIQSLIPSSKNEVALTITNSNKQTPTINQTTNADSVSILSNVPVSNETVALNKKVSNAPGEKEYKSKNKNDFNKPMATTAGNSLFEQDSKEVAATAMERDINKSKDKVDSPQNNIALLQDGTTIGRSKVTDTIRNFDVVLQRADRGLEEVVVSKKAKSNAVSSRRQMFQIDTLEPAIGWSYFDEYIASNMKSPTELKIKPVSGEVELSFELNKQGEPVNITVTKSLCDKCDEEAIRLLKEGPKWKNKAKNGKVKIRF
jgi:hypothetical protein